MATSPIELLNLSWKESDIDGSLNTLRLYAETEAQKQIDWYNERRTIKARISTTLRFAAILLFVIGTLVPILKAVLSTHAVEALPFDFGESGYLLIAVAGGCVAMDRFFGYSSGWIRCITTSLAIEKSLEEFRMEWARNRSKLRGGLPDESQVDQMILTCENFSATIRGQVEQETKAWILEFQGNLVQLEKDLQAKAEEVKARNQKIK